MKDKDNRPNFNLNIAGKKRICILHTKWNANLVESLVSQVKSGLTGHEVDIRTVPGCYELPIACQKLCQKMTDSKPYYDCIVAVGVLIKGETFHFEYIAQSVVKGLMDVQLKYDMPIVFGVLTTSSEKQVTDRIELELGLDWAGTALELTQF
eukprot:NODE_536_length_6333_cov_0.998877.p7 type:complete len:152 gc:universal NODE_536_length_6333_cov_0.998877:1717-2172(+)